MEPVKSYEISKEAQYREVEAEFERCWREQMDNLNTRKKPLVDRLIFGLASITLGIVMIVQALAG